jgi:hypothetical protein
MILARISFILLQQLLYLIPGFAFNHRPMLSAHHMTARDIPLAAGGGALPIAWNVHDFIHAAVPR